MLNSLKLLNSSSCLYTCLFLPQNLSLLDDSSEHTWMESFLLPLSDSSGASWVSSSSFSNLMLKDIPHHLQNLRILLA